MVASTAASRAIRSLEQMLMFARRGERRTHRDATTAKVDHDGGRDWRERESESLLLLIVVCVCVCVSDVVSHALAFLKISE